MSTKNEIKKLCRKIKELELNRANNYIAVDKKIDDINKRLGDLECKFGKKKAEIQDLFWVTINPCVEHDEIWKQQPSYWQETESYYLKNMSSKEFLPQGTIQGLQPGMLCCAVKEDGEYRITEVVECNLPIEVEWRRCKYYTDHQCVNKPWDENYVGCEFDFNNCAKVPYLPGTDVLITCEFTEKSKKELKPIAIMCTRVERKDATGLVECDCGRQVSFRLPSPEIRAFAEGCFQSKPKLITLEVLKEKGVTCEWALEWFRDLTDGWNGRCTLPTLCIHIARTSTLTSDQRRDAMLWIVRNLWDDYA